MSLIPKFNNNILIQETYYPNDFANVVDNLNSILADLFTLYLKTINFHWHVSGPHFRDYHLLLHDQATQILGTADAIAERIRKTGSGTLRSIGDIARRQRIHDNDSEFVSTTDMLIELHEDNMQIVTAFRQTKQIADEAGDNATSGLLDKWVDLAEERAWFLFEMSRE